MPSSESCLCDVLPQALKKTYERVAQQASPGVSDDGYLKLVKQNWLAAIRASFADFYGTAVHPTQVVCYGGRPIEDEDGGAPSGLSEWGSRWEFQFDVSVLAIGRIDAAYGRKDGKPRQVPIVDRLLWAVESEMERNGLAVAEDASKLRSARAENSLLIVCETSQKMPARWMRFVGDCMRPAGGNRFLAFMPTYASRKPGYQHWLDKTVELRLFRCDSVMGPEYVKTIGAPAPAS